jgi:hypothetical protein
MRPLKNKRGYGRAKYKDAAALQKKIDDYFLLCEKDKKPPTQSGLMYHLDYNYWMFYDLRDHPKFSKVIERTIDRMTNVYESLLIRSGNNGGAIFWLKNHGWRDQVDVTSAGAKLGATIIVSDTEVKDSLEEAVKNVDANNKSIQQDSKKQSRTDTSTTGRKQQQQNILDTTVPDFSGTNMQK